MVRRQFQDPNMDRFCVLDPNLDRFWGMHAEAVGAKAKINLISFVLQTWPLPARPLRTGGDARLHP